jgi:hypothetical protein
LVFVAAVYARRRWLPRIFGAPRESDAGAERRYNKLHHYRALCPVPLD